MPCNCTPTYPVPTAAASINLGQYTAHAAVNVIFVTATGRQDVFAVTADNTGNIILPLPQLRRSTPYTVTVALQADAAQTPVTLTYGTTTTTCITITFDAANGYAPTIFDVTPNTN